MKKIICFLLVLFPFGLSAQPYWNISFGGASIDEATSISSDAAGNIYVTGYFSMVAEFGSTTLMSNGVTDIFVLKLNPAGNVIWAVKAGGPGADRALAIKADAQGNAYITGYFHGTAQFGSTTVTASGAEEDMFVAKYNTSGALQWVKTGGGYDTDMGNGITVDNSGNVIVTGQFKSTAVFDGMTITSMNNPQGQPSIDVFVAKYNPSGSLQWLKTGKAKQTDRGIDIATDNAGNIYVAGQFSDTITFDVQHNNTMYNSIFLVKFNSAGQEQWFRRIGGGQYNVIYGLAADDNALYLTGDFSANLIFFGPPNYVLYGGQGQSYFVAKYSLSGNHLWSAADTSENTLHVRDITVDNNGNAYVIGDFKCVFTQMAALYGSGIFNSVGFEDVFVTKYNSGGTREWCKQVAGRRKDNGYGITFSNGKIYIAGSFKNSINYPAVPNWSQGNTNSLAPGGSYYCGDYCYSLYKSSVSNGEEDIFVAQPIDATRQPYDYYYRSGSQCIRDFRPVCINQSGNEIYCPSSDTLTACGQSDIYAVTRTCSVEPNGVLGIGPDYKYLWSTGDTNRKISVSVSGVYSVTVTTRDGCFVSSDSKYVKIFPLPAKPLISDNKGVNLHASNPAPVSICYPDSVMLTGENSGNNAHVWTGPLMVPNSNDTCIWVSNYGTYFFKVTDANGCTNKTSVLIKVYNNLAPLLPYVVFAQDTDNDDTVAVCSNQFVNISVHETSNPNACFSGTILWYINQVYSGTTSNSCTHFWPQGSGWYNVMAIATRMNVCDTAYDTVSGNIYVMVYPLPQVTLNVSTPIYKCPGQPVTLIASGAQTYQWYLGNLAVSNNDTLVTNLDGFYILTGTNQYNGLSCSKHLYIEILEIPAPVASMNPETGLICPNDSVYISVNVAGSYEWFGPDGLPFATSQGVYVNTPGYYYCVVTTPSGCVLTSNTVEVVQYTTPFLEATPSPMLCPGQTVQLNLYTNAGSIINWLPPLWGNNTVQVVNAPGTYACDVISCGILTHASITIMLSQTLAQITVNGNDTVCQGDTVYLYGNYGMIDYIWQPGGIHSSVLEVTQSGTYTLTTYNQDNCMAVSEPVSIYFIPYTAPVPVVSSDTVCFGQQAVLTAQPSGIYNWYLSPNTLPVFTGNPYITPPITSPLHLYVEVLNGGICPPPMTQVLVDVFPLPDAQITLLGDSLLCPGDTLTLMGPQGMQNYSWQPSGASSSAIVVNQGGIYSLTVTDSNGCQNNSFVKVFSHHSGFEDIYIVDSFACLGWPAEIDVLPAGFDYIWYDSLNGNIIYTGNPFVTPPLFTPTIYYLVAYDHYCYSNPIPVLIDIIICDKAHTSNVFTPNNDGFNDVFKIILPEAKSIRCEIFNRFGKLIYSWDDVNGYWDGTNQLNGLPTSEGVYYYVARYVTHDNSPGTISGSVQLLR